MAVYTHVSFEAANRFFQNYRLGEATHIEGIEEGIENSNYLLKVGQTPYILTLFEKRTQENELPFFMALMKHLVAQDFPVPAPIADKDGHDIGQLCQRPAAIISFLEGTAPLQPTPAQCSAVGATLAQLHQDTSDFYHTRENQLSLEGWLALFNDCSARVEEYDLTIKPFLENALPELKNHWPSKGSLPSGIIHADLFPDNVFFQRDQVSGVIDYYFACTDAYAYDLAITLNAWCFSPEFQFLPEHARSLIKGYESVRPLNDQEKALSSLLCRGAAMRFLLTRLQDWLYRSPDAIVRVKDPLEYIQKLRFHQQNEILGIL